MTGYSGGKKRYGHPVAIPPEPKSMVALAHNRELEIARRLADEKRAKDRVIFYGNLRKSLSDSTIDITSMRQKYTAEMARLKEKATAPESKIRIAGEKNLAKQRKQNRDLKNDIRRSLTDHLGSIKLYQDLYLGQSGKKVEADLKGLINLYFYLYKEVVRNKLQADIYDFITSMEDSIFNFYVSNKKSS
jgi:hypothetical protein